MSYFPTYIDLNNNQEWAIVNMEANLQLMFDKLKDHYWQKWLKNVKFVIKWDHGRVISNDSVFKIFEDEHQVLISTTAMTRPRIQLVSILLHVLIHIFISTCSKDPAKIISIHNENFRKIMLFLNETLDTQISVRFTLKLSSFLY